MDKFPLGMSRPWASLKRFGIAAVKNGDISLAIIVAACAAYGEAFGGASTELVNLAILALLAGMAIEILRGRLDHGGLGDLRQVAEDAVSERPYVVAWQSNHWDLIDRHRVWVTSMEQLRFTRSHVSENWLVSNGPGKLKKVHARWRRRSNDAWVKGRKVYQLESATGIKEVFTFGDEQSRGDVVEWCVQRAIEGQFPDENEQVSVEAATKSDHPRSLRITFPRDVEPTRVDIREGDRLPRPLKLHKKDDRSYVRAEISGLKIGEKVNIDWTW